MTHEQLEAAVEEVKKNSARILDLFGKLIESQENVMAAYMKSQDDLIKLLEGKK